MTILYHRVILIYTFFRLVFHHHILLKTFEISVNTPALALYIYDCEKLSFTCLIIRNQLIGYYVLPILPKSLMSPAYLSCIFLFLLSAVLVKIMGNLSRLFLFSLKVSAMGVNPSTHNLYIRFSLCLTLTTTRWSFSVTE